MSKTHIVVLGAGITGLQTAVSLLESDYAVTVIAKHFPGDKSIEYTSPWAGAQWRTHASRDDEEQRLWDMDSYHHWIELLKKEPDDGAEIGLRLYDSHFYWWHPDPEVPDGDATKVWFAPLVREFAAVERQDLPKGAWAGATYKSIMVNPPRYLSYLLRRATSLGANVFRASIPVSSDISGAISATKELLPSHLKTVGMWVNATGMGARRIVPDDAVFPIRGQTVIVKGEASRITTVEDRNPTTPNVTYILPRPASGTSVLGGTKQAGDWQAEADEATTNNILERAKRWAPELLTGPNGTFEVLDVCVGLRPGRKGGARVGIERLKTGAVVCHAYGHAGAGYQNSIGSARKVVKLITAELKAAPTPRL